MRKMRTAAFAGAAAAALLFGGLTAAPANAITEVYETWTCDAPVWADKLFIMYTDQSELSDYQRCWVGSGDVDVSQTDVSWISGGPYSGYINYKPGDGQTHSQAFSANQKITKDFGEVVHIHID